MHTSLGQRALRRDPRLGGRNSDDDAVETVPGVRRRLSVVWSLRRGIGYTIMDNVFILNGTLFVVTDDLSFSPARFYRVVHREFACGSETL